MGMQYNAGSDAIIQAIQQLVRPGAPEPRDPHIIAELQDLTAALIRARGRYALREDPLTEARHHAITLYEAAVHEQVAGKTVAVTGGAGMVGSHLIARLLRTDVQKILSIDNLRGTSLTHYQLPANADPRVVPYRVDIRDRPALAEVFARERPQIVFHLANGALNPGDAEQNVRVTLTTNVLGTQNIIDLCEQYGVERCVYSSTGKASSYFTSHTYAASKKITEWQLAAAAAQGAVGYGMVRFTHILQNSPISWLIEKRLERGLISLHAPYRFIYAQNVNQAVHLLLNALVLLTPGRLKFFVVKELGWPVDVLDLALHKIVAADRLAAIYFEGMPTAGYEEHNFAGQFDRSRFGEINGLVNVLETQTINRDRSGDMFIAEVPADAAIQPLVERLTEVLEESSADAEEARQMCHDMVHTMTCRQFAQADPAVLLNILQWGLEPWCLGRAGAPIAKFQEVLTALCQALYGRLSPDLVRRADEHRPRLAEMAEALADLPLLNREVDYLRRVVVSAEATQALAAAES